MAAINAAPRPLPMTAAQRLRCARSGLSRAAIVACVACLALSAFPAVAQRSKAPPAAAILAENAKWAAAFHAGDFAAIGALYTEDASLLPPGGLRVTGQEAITRFFREEYAGRQPGSIRFSDEEFYGDDRTVTEVASLTIRAPDGTLKARGKQILVFLKRGNAWKLHRDIWNSDPG